MTLAITSTTITQQDFRRISSRSSRRKPILIIGPGAAASTLAVNTAKRCTTTTEVVDYCLHGPLVEAACDSLTNENRAAIIMRTAATGTAATYVSVTGTFADADAPTVAGDSVVLPEDDLEPGIEFVEGGTLGTTGITYRYRTGGTLSASLSGVQSLGTATSITLPYGAGKYVFTAPAAPLVALVNELRTDIIAHLAHVEVLASVIALANELKADYNAHRVLIAASVHGAADATNPTTAADATDLASVITLLNELRTDYEAHRVLIAASVHGAADSTNVVSASAATDLPTAAVLADDLRTQYEAHRVLIAASVHGAADSTNVVSASATTTVHGAADATSGAGIGGAATNVATAITLVNQLRTAYEAHRVLIAASVHGAADSTNVISAVAATDSFTAVTLANEIKVDYEAHRVLTAASVHNATDTVNTISAANSSPGVIAAGDTVTAITSAQRWSVEELGAALDAVNLLPASLDYDGILLCGPVANKTEADAIAAKVEALKSRARWRRLQPHFRARNDGETITAYRDAFETAFGQVSQRRLHGAAVSCYMQSSHPNRFGQVDVRPFSFVYFARLCTLRPDINPTDETDPPNGFGSFTRVYVRDPDAPADILPRAVDDGHTELFTPLRAVAPRTKDQVSESIVFVGQGAMLAPEGSDYYIAPYARIIDEACNLAFRPLEVRLGRKVLAAADGTMDANERKRIEAGIEQDLNSLVTSGVVQSITVTIDPDARVDTTPPVTVPVTISVAVGGYIDAWTVDISLA